MSGKKLMNEQLPAPVIARRDAPRDRVLRHMRDALAAGASVALLTGCPFAVVDPLPPPAQCRSMGADALVTATVTELTADGGPRQVRVTLESQPNSGIGKFGTATVTGGTLAAGLQGARTFDVEPAAGATSFTLTVPAACSDDRSADRTLSLRVVVTLSGASPSATVTEVK